MRGIKTRGQGKWKRLGIFLILLLIFGALLNSVRKVYNKKAGAEKALARMQAEIKTLEDRQKFLENELDRLATDEGVKFEIRKKLNVSEAGESVALIINEDASAPALPPSLSVWQKLKNFFVWLFE